MKRRGFLKATAAALPAVGLSSCGGAPELDLAALRALSHSLLPAELGMEAHVRIAGEFLAWATGFSEGAELVHGYGTGDIRFAEASPLGRWQQQLEALARESEAHFGAGLEFISDPQRLQLVRDALEAADARRLPDPQDADHVALAILAFFYSGPEATDLAYRAAIRREQCRPLAQSPRKPVSLETQA